MTGIYRLAQDERGATAIEYGLIVALIAISIIGGMNYFASETIGMWDYIVSSMSNASV